MLKQAVASAEKEAKATVFGYWVNDPKRYGVAEFDHDGNCLTIEEKPEHPQSNYAVVGLYFYPKLERPVEYSDLAASWWHNLVMILLESASQQCFKALTPFSHAYYSFA